MGLQMLQDIPAIHKIALVLVGLGKQGQRVLKEYEAIQQMLPQEYQLELTHYVEPDPRQCKIAEREVPSFAVTPARWTSTLKEALSDLAEQGRRKRYKNAVIYDATPSHLHLSNLVVVHRFSTLNRELVDGQFFNYFGEKPLVTMSDEKISEFDTILVSGLESIDHYCNFVERYNPVILALQRDTDERKLRFSDVRLWRSSCIAIEQHITAERDGVTGGAFLDKTIHDISILASLFRLQGSISDTRNRLKLKSAKASHYLPFQLSPTPLRAKSAKSLSGIEWKDNGALPPSESRTHVEMSLDGGTVQLVASWIGLDSTMTLQMEDLRVRFGLKERSLVWNDTELPREFRPGLRKDEARVIYANTIDTNGAAVEYLGNLLTRPESDTCAALNPWLCRKTEDGCEILPVTSVRSTIQLCFLDVIGHIIGRQKGGREKLPQSLLDKQASAVVHSIAHDIRSVLNNSYADADDVDKSVEAARREALARVIAPYAFAVPD